MPVRRRFNQTGPGLVFVTTTVVDWLAVFSVPDAAHVALDQLGSAIRHFDASLVAYVLMPSHLHLLLGLRGLERLSQFMQSYKILTSKRVKLLDLDEFAGRLQVKGRFRLWMPRFDDLVITSDEQFKVKIEYIHNNPVKAGLVSDAPEYAYSSASDWLDGRPGLLRIDKELSWIR